MDSFAEFDQATIAAIATPAGAGGIGIIRISGGQAASILTLLFRPARPASPLRTHQLRYGWIIDPGSGRPLDEVMAVLMSAPATYTREDVVEIHGHGGQVVLREILALVLAAPGVRAAEPGEFTKRAFLNGRIDLTRAEAVLDLLNAGTRQSLDLAVAQLAGGLHGQLHGIREALLELLAVIEVAIDFPDEDGEIIDRRELGRRLESRVHQPLLALAVRARQGRIYREGAAVVILGRPNVGKSSLLNALLGEERAIVTAIPGTTRDTIEECLNIHGIPLRIIDTAGIRETTETVEGLGIARSRRRVAEADLVLLLVEAGEANSPEDLALYATVRERKTLLVVNKLDLLPEQASLSGHRAPHLVATGPAHVFEDAPPSSLPQPAAPRDRIPGGIRGQFQPQHRAGAEEESLGSVESDPRLGHWRQRFSPCPVVGISARTGAGLAGLEAAIFRLLCGGEPREPGHLSVPNARHEAALARALPATERLAAGLAGDLAPELLAVELQAVLGYLGEIIGEISSDDLLESIFSRFCIGK